MSIAPVLVQGLKSGESGTALTCQSSGYGPGSRRASLSELGQLSAHSGVQIFLISKIERLGKIYSMFPMFYKLDSSVTLGLSACQNICLALWLSFAHWCLGIALSLYFFPAAAGTSDHKLSHLKQHALSCHSTGGEKSLNRGLAGLFPAAGTRGLCSLPFPAPRSCDLIPYTWLFPTLPFLLMLLWYHLSDLDPSVFPL